jgi:hypothetical protein
VVDNRTKWLAVAGTGAVAPTDVSDCGSILICPSCGSWSKTGKDTQIHCAKCVGPGGELTPYLRFERAK